MKKITVSLVSVAFALLPFNAATAYSHANRYGGSTSHSYGSTSHSSAYGTSTSHTYGEGSSHTNEYGGSTSHNYDGGTSHTNAYGGTTSGEAGYGATHTDTYGATTAYHPPLTRTIIHPHRTIRIIRQRPWATTEQGATTAVRLRAPSPWALRSAWLPAQP